MRLLCASYWRIWPGGRLDLSPPRAAPGFHSEVKRHAGPAALIHGCQPHQWRSGLEQLADEYQPGIHHKLLTTCHGGIRPPRGALDPVNGINPSAARSMEEGWNKPRYRRVKCWLEGDLRECWAATEFRLTTNHGSIRQRSRPTTNPEFR